MDQMLGFTVGMSKDVLAELALNMNGLEGIDGMGSAELSALLHDVIASELEDYLGESDDISIQFIGQDAKEVAFDVQIPVAALNDVLLNEHGIETVNEIEPEKVNHLLGGMISEGLQEFTGEVGEFRVVRARHR